jgi:5-formyltetrahydrofolate cyclo-ligase
MSDLESQKKQLRRDMRARRANLDPAEQRQCSEQLCTSIEQLPGWANCRSIALYLASDGEIDPSAISTRARSLGKQILLPVLADNSLVFATWDEGEPMQDNHFGIPEPGTSAARVAAADIDIICLPLVAWDKAGGRLGMGGGFYDRTLANIQVPTLVGLGHSFQEVAEVPMESWDARLEFIATENGLTQCQG